MRVTQQDVFEAQADAQAADDRFHEAVVAWVGEKRAGDARYLPRWKKPPEVQRAGDEYHEASERLRVMTDAMRHADSDAAILLDVSDLSGDDTPVSLAQFIAENTAPGVTSPTQRDVERLRRLRPGDSLTLDIGGGGVEVRRLAGGGRRMGAADRRPSVRGGRNMRGHELYSDEMLEGAARALYVSAWASAWEYAVEDDRATGHPWSGGDELTEVAPDTPADMTEEAEVLLRTTAMDNRVNLTEMANEAGIDEWSFGFALAMEAMGHGVGLHDEKTADGDYFEHDLKLPYVEPIVDITDEEIEDEDLAPDSSGARRRGRRYR